MTSRAITQCIIIYPQESTRMTCAMNMTHLQSAYILSLPKPHEIGHVDAITTLRCNQGSKRSTTIVGDYDKTMANSVVGGLRLRVSAIVVHSHSPRTTQSEIVWLYAHSHRLNYGPDLKEIFSLFNDFHLFIGSPKLSDSFKEFYQPCKKFTNISNNY